MSEVNLLEIKYKWQYSNRNMCYNISLYAQILADKSSYFQLPYKMLYYKLYFIMHTQ